MKVTVNIELWDNTSTAELEQFGLTTKFLKLCYEESFKQLVNKLCENGMEHTLNVEMEDNTVN